MMMQSSNEDEASATLYRRGCQTTLGCKRCKPAVVNVKRKGFARGQVSHSEVTAKESLKRYRNGPRGKNRSSEREQRPAQR